MDLVSQGDPMVYLVQQDGAWTYGVLHMYLDESDSQTSPRVAVHHETGAS